MGLLGERAAALREFLPVPVAYLDTEELPFDLYIRDAAGKQHANYRSAGLPFRQKHRDRLIEQSILHLYVPAARSAELTAIVSANMEKIHADPTLSDRLKRDIVSGVCTRLMDDVMSSATRDAISALADLGDTIASTPSAAEPDFLQCLLDMSGHDFGTSVHMMNVGIGCGLLAKRLHPDRPDFIASIIKGGFVHDLGKSAVPAEILNKNGRLTDEEFAVIKTHPAEGATLLESIGVADPVMLETTRDHHEHLSGTGYPEGKKDEQLGDAARIAAVVDVYDALTAARPYRAPIAWEDALEMLKEHRGTQFDPDVLDAWADIVAAAAERHDDELPENTAGPMPLGDALPLNDATAEALGGSDHPGSSSEDALRPCRIRARLSHYNAGRHGNYEVATITEISKGALRFICERNFAVKTPLRIATDRNDGSTFTALVIWSRRSRNAGEGWLHEARIKQASPPKAA